MQTDVIVCPYSLGDRWVYVSVFRDIVFPFKDGSGEAVLALLEGNFVFFLPKETGDIPYGEDLSDLKTLNPEQLIQSCDLQLCLTGHPRWNARSSDWQRIEMTTVGPVVARISGTEYCAARGPHDEMRIAQRTADGTIIRWELGYGITRLTELGLLPQFLHRSD
jgi:hypothetical protein